MIDLDKLPRDRIDIWADTIKFSENPAEIGRWDFLVAVSDEEEQFFGTYCGPSYTTAILEAERLASERGFPIFDFVGELS